MLGMNFNMWFHFLSFVSFVNFPGCWTQQSISDQIGLQLEELWAKSMLCNPFSIRVLLLAVWVMLFSSQDNLLAYCSCRSKDDHPVATNISPSR